MMKVMRLIDAGPPPELAEATAPRPQPQTGELLVRIRAAGIISTEPLWSPTSQTRDGRERKGAVLTHEFSGTIAELGARATGVSSGDEIYGMNDWYSEGALAEYCITRPEWIAPKPKSLTHAEAASVPISALTAWQGLLVRARLQAGERLLIHGAAGAVGIFAVQLARRQGAYIVGTASAADLPFVTGLGAQQVMDYRAGAFEEQLRDMDVVFDCVGGETLRRSWGVLKPNGRMVTIAASSEAQTEERVKQVFFIVEPDRRQLVEVANLIDAGELRTVVGSVIPLAQASKAYSGTLQPKPRGKVVVQVSA